MHLNVQVTTMLTVITFFLLISLFSNMSAHQQSNKKYDTSFSQRIQAILNQTIQTHHKAKQDTDPVTRMLHLNQASTQLHTLRHLFPDQDLEKIGKIDPYELSQGLNHDYSSIYQQVSQWLKL